MTARALMGLVRRPGVVSAEALNVLGRDALTPSRPRLARATRQRYSDGAAGPALRAQSVKSIQAQLEEALTLHQRLSRRARLEAVKAAVAAVGLDLPVLNHYQANSPAGWASG